MKWLKWLRVGGKVAAAIAQVRALLGGPPFPTANVVFEAILPAVEAVEGAFPVTVPRELLRRIITVGLAEIAENNVGG